MRASMVQEERNHCSSTVFWGDISGAGVTVGFTNDSRDEFKTKVQS